MTKRILFAVCAILALGRIPAQDVVIKIVGGEKPSIAIPDFRGAGDAAKYMSVFNQTLFSDIQDSGLFKMASKSLYPLVVPQQPSDFQQPGPNSPAKRPPWLTDWSSPPASAKYLAFGYGASQNNQIVLSGWLFDVEQANVAGAQLMAKRYFGPVDENGARKVAHEFACDIIVKFGSECLLGSHIYFVSDRTGHKEVWSMDPDGANQKQITRYNSVTTTPGISPDGTKLAFTTFANGHPGIFVICLETESQ